MRIRKRPSLQSLCSILPKPDPSKESEESKVTGGITGAVGRDPPDPLVQPLHPQHSTCELLKEEKILVVDASPSSSSPPQYTLDSQITSDRKSARCSEERVAPSKDCSDGKGKKKGSAPPVLMEGSRCSRVNGRGWRCCQQTLVGYSLCEHHLGKGRLRSMNSTNKSRNTGTATRRIKNAGSTEEKEDGRKVGTMKARSISSLLDETDHAAAAIISSLATSASK